MSFTENNSGKSVNNPHDAALKSAFQKKEVALSFFQNYLPEKIRKCIDFDHLELGNKSYVDEKLRDKHSDIIYKTRIKNTTAFLYILFEHQSTPDPVMIFRILCYMVNIWKEYEDQNPGADSLPLIFPAVLYHGKAKWNSPRTMTDLIKADDVFSEYLPDFTYKLYDLGDYQDEMLILGEHMALSVVLYLFKHIFDKDFQHIFGQAVNMLTKIGDRKIYLEFFEWLLRYTYHARNEDEKTVRGYIDSEVEKLNDEKVRRLAMSVAEQIRQRALTEGRAVLIQKQLNKRFCLLSPMLEQKLRNSGLDILDKFGESIFDFKDLKDAEKWWDLHGTKR
jgi:predicted transposase/invertase (TIGR01784 family)